MIEIENWTGIFHHGDSRKVLRSVPNNSVDLVVTSPPYNVNVDYGVFRDDLDKPEYRLLIRDVFQRLQKLVVESGRVCVNISLKNDECVVDTPKIIKEEAYDCDWNLRFEIVWDKGSSESSSAWGSWRSPSSPRPIFNHEYIFVFDVGEETKKYEKSIEKERFMRLVKSVWNVKPKTHSEHPAAFPVEIPKRLIELNSYENDVVLDPFSGSGTTAVAAERLNREWIGIELNQEYIDMAEKRIDNECQNNQRKMGVFDY